MEELCLSSSSAGYLTEWRVTQGQRITKGTPLCRYKLGDQTRELKSPYVGQVVRLLVGEMTEVGATIPVVRLQSGCDHSVVAFDMCAHCGTNLRKHPGRAGVLESTTTAHVPVVHTVPQLKVSETEARRIASRDEGRLLQQRKLVLIVDLDQTLIHTTVDPSIEPGLKDVYGFQLPGYPHFYHCRLRPGAKDFVSNVSANYEMHVFTLGGRDYAHTVAGILDPDEKLFARRVLSRDELLDQNLKTSNLRAFFPIDDSMVVIIDDREDVWASIPNLIVVKPYHFFKGIGDIHSPTGNSEESTESAASQGDPSTNERVQTKATGTERKEISQVSTVEIQTTQKAAKEAAKGNCSEKEGVADNQEDDKSSHSSLSRSSSTGSVSSSSSASDSQKQDQLNLNQEEPRTEENSKVENKHPAQIKPSGPERDDVRGKISVQGPVRRMSHVLSKAMLALEENDKDTYLNHLSETLGRIHSAFYEEFDQMSDGSRYPDVREIIPHMKRRVLQGVNLVFSSVFPTNMSRPEDHPIWRTATGLGATVCTDIVPPNDDSTVNPSKKQKCDETAVVVTTHVVSAKSDTYKAYQAQKIRGVYLVSPDWLWCCSERWEWVDEKMFPVDDLPVSVDLSDKRLARPTNKEKDRTENSVATKRCERLFSDEDLAEMDREVNEALGSEDSSSNSEGLRDGAGIVSDSDSNGFFSKMAGSLSPSDAESEESSQDGESGQSSSSDEDQMAALLDEEISHF